MAWLVLDVFFFNQITKIESGSLVFFFFDDFPFLKISKAKSGGVTNLDLIQKYLWMIEC